MIKLCAFVGGVAAASLVAWVVAAIVVVEVADGRLDVGL